MGDMRGFLFLPQTLNLHFCHLNLELCCMYSTNAAFGILHAAFVRKFGNLCSDKSFSGLLFSIALSAGYPVGKDKDRTSPKANSVWGFENLK